MKGGEKKDTKREKVSREDAELLAEEEEARTRQIFDPGSKIYDDRKRRVTDLKEC